MKKILSSLTAMTGGNMLGFAVLGGVILFSAGHLNGVRVEKNAEALRQAKAEKNLDKQSVTVDIDTGKIAKEVNAKINMRMGSQAQIDTDELEAAAKKIGELEGQAEGYKKGFEDAKKIVGSCYNDPKFLSDSLRLGAEARYGAIFGSPPLAGPSPDDAAMLDRAGGDARGQPPG